jgi:hypothetical protein
MVIAAGGTRDPAGARVIAEPFGTHPGVVDLVLRCYHETVRARFGDVVHTGMGAGVRLGHGRRNVVE